MKIRLKSHYQIALKAHTASAGFPLLSGWSAFSCSCCPPNLNRLLPALSGYIYGIENETLFVNQFADSILSDGGIECSMHTDYPRSGTVKISARGVKNVAVRIPSWCAAFTADRAYKMKEGYAVMESGGEIVLEFDMSPFCGICRQQGHT